MGTIVERKKIDGTPSFTAQIRKTANGKVIFNETQTFSKRRLAEVWLAQREAELAKGLPTRNAPITLHALIDRYLAEYPGGRTKIMDLKYLRRFDLCQKNVYDLTAGDYLAHVKERLNYVQPQTVTNDFIWLQQILQAAKTDWGLPVSDQALTDAREHARRNQWVAHSEARNRRLLPDEYQRLMDFFAVNSHSLPMKDLINFALASVRRQEEITQLRWADWDEEKSIIVVRKVKHPRKKQSNDRTAKLTPEAQALIQQQPRTHELIFPYNPRSIGAAFTRACKLLGIQNLHFHDLRHEGITRLFEKGYQIHEVALFSLHTSWTTLQRYTHLKPEDVPNR